LPACRLCACNAQAGAPGGAGRAEAVRSSRIWTCGNPSRPKRRRVDQIDQTDGTDQTDQIDQIDETDGTDQTDEIMASNVET
jgi:hypothetical protein